LQFIADERGPALALIGKNTGVLFDAMTIDEPMGGATWDCPVFPSRFRLRFGGYQTSSRAVRKTECSKSLPPSTHEKPVVSANPKGL
jgi:hypothetical protein